MTMTGGCLCGAVRYEIKGEPVFAGKCYCPDCQKESSTGHSTVAGFADGNVALTGEMQAFEKVFVDGRKITRSFCPRCGSTLLAQEEGYDGISLIRAGTLDESDDLEMQMRMAVFCNSARSWDRPPEGITQFPGMPPDS